MKQILNIFNPISLLIDKIYWWLKMQKYSSDFRSEDYKSD